MASPTLLPDPLPILPNGHVLDASEAQALVEAVGALGVPPAEAHTWLRYVVARLAQPPPDREMTRMLLEAEWGEATPRNLLAVGLARQRLPASAQWVLLHTRLGDDAPILRRLARLGAPLLLANEET